MFLLFLLSILSLRSLYWKTVLSEVQVCSYHSCMRWFWIISPNLPIFFWNSLLNGVTFIGLGNNVNSLDLIWKIVWHWTLAVPLLLKIVFSPLLCYRWRLYVVPLLISWAHPTVGCIYLFGIKYEANFGTFYFLKTKLFGSVVLNFKSST